MQSPYSVSLKPAPSRAAAAVFTVNSSDTLLNDAISELAEAFPHRFARADANVAENTVTVDIHLDPALGRRLSITRQDTAAGSTASRIDVRCADTACAMRALGIIFGRMESGLSVICEEERAFEKLGVMIDTSRNGVPRLQSLRKLIRHLALMGINQLLLYMEDTYEIPGEPLFGYFRGRYSQQDLRSIDDYAFLFGIEVVPCIQTLGHMEQVLKWPCYLKMRDTPTVLLAGDTHTDAFVEKMIAAASAPFRSRRIHIGMDEADGVGAGIYRVRNGARPAFDILTEHLRRTTDTCSRLGLQPMIWSDMFFRLGSKTHEYYDRNSVISEQTIASVPADVDFVYWDYYHNDPAFYEEWIGRHRAMGKEPVYAGGVWAWNRWWAQLDHSVKTLRAGMGAARSCGLQEAFVTIWADDGAESDPFSALPGIQFFAEMGYTTAEQADANLQAHLRGSCEASLPEWLAAGSLDLVPREETVAFHQANPSKWILWLDPLLGFLDRHISPAFTDHYNQLAQRLADASRTTDSDARLRFAALVAQALTLKCQLHQQLRPAYQRADKAALRSLLESTIPQLTNAVTTLRKHHEALWNELYRPFGWETIERRYAGLLSRLGTLSRKLEAHLASPSAAIEELACQSTEVWPAQDFFSTTFRHDQVATASYIS